MELPQRLKTWLSRIKTFQDQRENQELIQPSPRPVWNNCVLECFCQCWPVWHLCCTITVHLLSGGFGPQMSIFPACCCSPNYSVWAWNQQSLCYSILHLFHLDYPPGSWSVRFSQMSDSYTWQQRKNGHYFPLYT